ncbi:hypothetical protein H6P81_001942 [Aristolochia fimbriata]|uniref:TF-B3 domain-containing protein n=1 Tax=Aristolochia fimbriata TaxID=158543 RepID=A0AAV7FA19_ARIFI|nr:hypothetical protein H6P81_001942 [Aristolochia fimbriata]
MSHKSEQIPSFFKVMIGNFNQRVKIPTKFVKDLKEKKMPNKLFLTRVGYRCWPVQVKKYRNHFFLQTGWSKFIKDNCIEVADFLVFYSDDKLNFNVIIFGPNACEKEFLRHEKVKVQGEIENKIPKAFGIGSDLWSSSNKEIYIEDPIGRCWPVNLVIHDSRSERGAFMRCGWREVIKAPISEGAVQHIAFKRFKIGGIDLTNLLAQELQESNPNVKLDISAVENLKEMYACSAEDSFGYKQSLKSCTAGKHTLPDGQVGFVALLIVYHVAFSGF